MDSMEIGEINIPDILIGDDVQLEFDLGDFDLTEKKDPPSRYFKPKFPKIHDKVEYPNAQQLVKHIHLTLGEQVHVIVNGNFIFGDFIEALLVDKNVKCQNMYISTLSLSQNNIDSLAGLLEDDYIGTLTMMISNYFYSHERNELIPYMLKALDQGDKYDLIVARNHTKVVLMEIGTMKIVMTGSANLRSSNSIEQFVIQESPELYEWYLRFFQDNAHKSIINKEVPK
jgi:hypothetical protein